MLNTWMGKTARQLIVDNLNENDTMVEFGSGGSTLDFSTFVKQYYSYEFNKQWFDKTSAAIQNKNLKNINYYYTPVAIPDYTNFITQFTNCKIGKIDKVLIDGRERVKCAKAIIPWITKDTLVFIHDWERERYKCVLEWYDIVEESIPESVEEAISNNYQALTVVLKLKES